MQVSTNVSGAASRRQSAFVNVKRFVKNGFTLIELLAVLAIAMVLGMIVWSQWGQASTSQEINGVSQEVATLRAGTKAINMGQNGYGTASLNSALITMGRVPSSLTTTAPSTITNAYSGAVVVTGATNTFTISYAAVPKETCIQLVSSAASQDWTGVTVGGTAAVLTLAGATTACATASNTIVWTN